MRRIYTIAMVISICMIDLSAADYYQSLRTHIVGMGQAIENVNNMPVIGKLTNMVPFAALASSLKECPLQTMVVLIVLGAYTLSYNSAMRQMVEKYEFTSAAPWIRKRRVAVEAIDDSFFTYDEDEEENEIIEDELLNTDLFDDEDDDWAKDRKRRRPENVLQQ